MEIGIRLEDKNQWEARVPLTPTHVAVLTAKGIPVRVQPSPIRAFPDDAYREAGATVDADLSACRLVFGVKEMPVATFQPGGAYVFFSHTIKGQSYNMPMLADLLQKGCTLIDYERIAEESGRRLVFFGHFAGLAGMIDSLWALGQRLQAEGIATPLANLKQAYQYDSLDAAKAAIRAVGEQIAHDGLDARLHPLVAGFTGYGNVSKGAQEIVDLLPVERIEAEDLAAFMAGGKADPHRLYKVEFMEKHMFAPRGEHAFELQDYFQHPEKYQAAFTPYLPHLTLLVNCIFWTPACPKLITADDAKALFAEGQPRLRVIGDVTCDPGGSIECTTHCTNSGEPVYVYDPATGDTTPGVEGAGPVVLAVDNLPCELPRESSSYFGDTLMPFVEPLARMDLSGDFASLALPADLKRAVIAYRGELTPEYRYLEQHLPRS